MERSRREVVNRMYEAKRGSRWESDQTTIRSETTSFLSRRIHSTSNSHFFVKSLSLKTNVVEFPLTHASYRDYCINVISTDIKESICRVSDFVFSEGDNSNMPTVSYEVNL